MPTIPRPVPLPLPPRLSSIDRIRRAVNRHSAIAMLMPAIFAKNPDPDAQNFKQKIGHALVGKMAAAWQEHLDSFSKARPFEDAFAGQALAERVRQWWSRLVLERQQVAKIRFDILKREQARILSEGYKYAPSADALRFPDLVQEIWERFQCLTSCPCDCDTSNDPPIGNQGRFGFKLDTMKCYDQSEVNNDEIFAICMAVDGNGAIFPSTTKLYTIDSGDNNKAHPNHWVYAPSNPNGFLDIGIELWEDDGDYDAIADIVQEIGGATALIPVPVVMLAGIAITITGSIIDLVGVLDASNPLGSHAMTYQSDSQLAGAVGTGGFTIRGSDFLNSYKYRLTHSLFSI